MRKLLVLSAAGMGLALTGCSFAGGALLGNSLWGENGYGIAQDFVLASMAGTSVVCLGTDADVDLDQEVFVIDGVVVSDEASDRDIGTVVGCQQDPARVLTIRDQDGNDWEVGYAWLDSDGWDMTPAPSVSEGERVEILVRRGPSVDSLAAGFTLSDSQGVIYAMEAGHGEGGLAQGDISGLTVDATRAVGTVDNDCGEATSVAIDFESEDDHLSLYPGEDASMVVDDEVFVTCNINSYESDDDCHDGGEVSWVMFQ
jgi:hypothetical protein